MSKSHWLFLLFTILLVGLLVLSGCDPEEVTDDPNDIEPPEDVDPDIKIGFLAPLTGTFAAPGIDMRDGLTLYMEENDWQLAGYNIEVIVEDTAGDPDTALTRARRLVEAEEVDFLMGGLLASEGYALADYAEDNEITYIAPIPASDDMTKALANDYFLRTGWSSSQPMHPFGEYVYEEMGYEKVALMGMDYAFGYETLGGFHETFEKAGGEVVARIWTPIGVPDFGPYMAEVADLADDIDALVVTYVGGDATRFIPAYEEYGLKDELPLLGTGTTTDQASMQEMGEECLGIITALYYSDGLDTPENEDYEEAFRARYGRLPSYYNEGPYTGAMALEAVLEEVGDDYDDPIAFAEAFRGIEITAPRGPMTIDEYNNPIWNVHVSEVQMVDGEMRNVVLDTIPDVDQWWTWEPEEFMDKPVYDRDYPSVNGN